LIIAPFASQESRKLAIEISNCDSRIRIIEQLYPGVGGAYKQGFEVATGDVIVLMSSDLETNPRLIPEMIAELMKNPLLDIVAISRWLKSNSFEGYSPILRLMNYMFQRLIRVLFGSSLTDFTYAFRAYKRESLIGIEWTERTHSFFLESLLRPLARGATVLELPGKWIARSQGVRHIERTAYWHYIEFAIRQRFRKG
jgi:glycosyltransferase involved in cell wall biosynthesis